MSTPPYNIGDLVRLRITFHNTENQPADPTTIRLRVLPPDGNETQHDYDPSPAPGADTLTRHNTGIYYYDYPADQRGEHLIRWEATGTIEAADLDRFYVIGDVFH